MKRNYTFLILTAIWGMWGCQTHSGTTDSTPVTRFTVSRKVQTQVEALMGQMTLDEKIGQLVLYSSHFTTTGPTLPKNVEEAIRNGTCGNIFNAHVPVYNRELQRIAVEETRMKIPLLFGYDVIHGMKTIFPINLGLSCSWDLAGIELSARVAAREAIASGLNWTFSPMVDITRDPRWGRVSEGSGEDVFLGCRIAEAMVRGYQGHRPEDLSSDSTILACAKHFAAYGAPEAGRDYNTVELSERTFRDIYLPTYQAAVDAGVASVMTSFNDVDAIPATANQYLLDQLLRQQWGFEGFVVTDFTSINELVPHGVAQDSMEAGQLAINAGVNMDLQGDIYHKYLRQLVESGRVSEQQVNRMCAQVLAVKFALGLFDDPYKYHNLKAAEREFYKPENLMAARRMACESMVLLENREQTLPLTVGQRVALIGPFAAAQQDLLGSWYGQGDSSHVVSIMQGMKERFGEQNVRYARGCSAEGSDLRGFGEALSVVSESDVVVLTVGLPGAWSGEATSLTFLTLPSIQQQLITALRQTGKPLVLLIVSGRPLDLSWEQAQCDAMLEVWYPGTEGGHAVADVLSGDFNPSGRLTMTFPASIGQVPIHYDAKQTGRPFTPDKGEQHYVSRYLNREDNRPLYPFGYGLSYTTFTYSDLKVTPAESNLREAVEVSVQVQNVGSRRGVEVVQLYVGDVVASVTRPVRQLRGFERIELDAGEQREVRFSLNGSALSFTRQDMQFGYEPGDFKVWVGGSSEATQEGTFRVLAK